MSVTPTAEGALLVRSPTPDSRYDMGNRRLFATLDGEGNIRSFRLPEGIAILDGWQAAARVDGVRVTWREAEAMGRSWRLAGEALDATIDQRTVCDAGTPALAQVWEVTNTGQTARVFTLSLEVTFDLRLPAVQVGSSSLNARVYRFLRDNPVSRRALGPRRWAVMNPLGEAQKRLKPAARRRSLEIDARRDGFRVRGDVTAALVMGDAPAEWQPAETGLALNFRAVVAPGETYTLPLLVGAGDGLAPDAYRDIAADADAFAAWLSASFECDDPLLRSLYAASLNVALAMYKELPSGFAGLWAGPGYAYPPRIYFRDSYWTALPILPYRPEWVRAHLLTLATGVHPDGVCPSGVIDPAVLPFEDQAEEGASDWLPDHQDSPAYFVLLLCEYVAWTGDAALLGERLDDGRTLWDCAQSCLNRLLAQPAKDRAPNDWADNVLRSEWVSYDLALLAGALGAAADVARHVGDAATASSYQVDARHIRDLLHIHGWDDAKGYLVDYRRGDGASGAGFVEDHLALDTLLAIRFGAASPDGAASMLAAARTTLQTRHNAEQPHGDWGVMCCWPPYSLRADLFGKSAQVLNYHNGAEWPFLSAIYAHLLMERGDPDWRYALTRWWSVHLERGWLTPVEYHSPAHPPGAFLQGWSGMAASAMLSGGLGLRPALDGTIAPRVPPWGACVAQNALVHGQPVTLLATETGVTVQGAG